MLGLQQHLTKLSFCQGFKALTNSLKSFKLTKASSSQSKHWLRPTLQLPADSGSWNFPLSLSLSLSHTHTHRATYTRLLQVPGYRRRPFGDTQTQCTAAGVMQRGACDGSVTKLHYSARYYNTIQIQTFLHSPITSSTLFRAPNRS
jgi:hypothetical protein